jgi:hypothetical protein
VDFVSHQGDKDLSAKFDQNGLWLAPWLHQWLVAHAAADFNFKPIATEAWHWEYKP